MIINPDTYEGTKYAVFSGKHEDQLIPKRQLSPVFTTYEEAQDALRTLENRPESARVWWWGAEGL